MFRRDYPETANTWEPYDNIKYCADIAEPALFICDEEFSARVGAMSKELSTVKGYLTIGLTNESGMENLEDLMQAASPAPLNVEISDEDECALYFTSGVPQERRRPCFMHTEASRCRQ